MRLNAKIILLIGAITLGVGLSSSVLMSRMMDEALGRELRNQAVITARALAGHITPNIINGETIPVREAMVEFTDRIEAIQYIYVVDFDGRVFAHTFRGGFPKALSPRLHGHSLGHTLKPEIHKYETAAGGILDVGIPLIEGMVAYVHIGMSEASTQAQIASLRNRILGLSFLLALVGIAIGTIISRRMTQPLAEMARTMHDFGEGKREEEIDFKKGGREIADLTRAFNRMISDRKQVEEALLESEKRYRTVFESAVDAIILLTAEGVFLDINPAYVRMIGRSRGELIGSSVTNVIHPDYSGDLGEFTQQIEMTGEVHLESMNIHRDGTPIPIEMHGTMIDYGNQPVMLGIIRDITERKRAEKDKEKLKDQLHQAQKMESIGRLAGGVAHDFNNILSAINGYAEICLIKMKDNRPLRKEVEIILQSGQRAARLTQQLLAFSRKQIIRREIIDVNRGIDDTRMMLEPLLGEDIEIEVLKDRELWSVKADRSQLEQVVLNLAVNARDAMPSGGKLTIETANVSLDEAYMKNHYNISAGDYVMLAISDNGLGMDEETMGHIFEPFFTTKEKGKGTGLGLATVYGIIKQNNGEIQVYSELGQGSTFKIYLPRAEEPLEKTDNVSSVEDISDNRGTETIMLVEDDEVVRNMSVGILADLGYTVLEAKNGEDALHVCSRFHGKIDLLLTDVVMPKMSGPALAAKMQEMCPKTKVVFMSGYTENAIVKHGVLADGVNFIHKPVTPQSLSRAVRKIFD